ncbi:MAG: LamG domain-containing protein [Bacteroidaceae bacterium]|nr:LamG domain-containing protein [Bacteroidaceae bacterium]
MKQKLLFSVLLSMACLTAMAQEVPTADLLDVQFNEDGTAVDLSPMHNPVNFFGNESSTVISHHSVFGRNIATFYNEWSKTATGYYRVDFEENQDFRDKLADGHSLEIMVKASYEGAIQNVEAKPFSAMQGGGTGFLICKTDASGSGGKNVFTFLPNVTTSGSSTWRWCTSGVTPISGFYYHVIGVWNKEEQKAYIYVDGELKNTVDAPGEFKFASSGCNWFCVGGDADPNSGAQSWTGDVVIARVYDKPLSGDEALALWNQVAAQEKEANNFVYTEAVAEGRTYLGGEDLVGTQDLIDAYSDALDALSDLVSGGTTEELEAQFDVVKQLRADVEASVAAYANYYAHVQTAIQYLDENDDFAGSDRDYIAAYLSDYIEPNEEYPHGSFAYIWDNPTLSTEEIGAEATWVDEKLSIAIANGYKPGSEITNLLTNPSFSENFSGWKGTVGTGVRKSSTTDYYGAETWARGFDMYQTITGLEPGVYVLSVTGGYRPFNDRYSTYYAAGMYLNENRIFFPTVYESRIPVEEAEDGVNCYLTQVGDDASVDLDISEEGGTDVVAYAMHGCTSVANAAAAGRAVSYLVAYVADSTLTVGFANPNANASSDWTGIANVRLLYAGSFADAEHYIDETLACMVARAQTIINITPDLGDYASAPNCPQAIKSKLQAAVDAVATTTDVEEKYALIGTFTSLWDEFMEGRAAYVKMIDEAETCLSIVSDLYAADKMTKDEIDNAQNAIAVVWDAFENGTYSTEEALSMDVLKTQNLIPEVDENGTYQIKSNYDMAYYCLKAGTTPSAVNGILLSDIDFFTEYQMMENFYGTLDGNYHTITVDIHRADRGAALINNMQDGSCVKNMTIKGEVHNSNKFVTAVAANTYNRTTISGIISLINGHSTCVGDSGNGGIMSCNRGSAVVKDCVFAGTMEGDAAINSSGIVGWTNGSTLIENCLQIGDITLNAEGSRTIARVPEQVILTNCYYKTAFGEEEGTQITDEQLASGEVCYLLNKGNTENPTWFQTLGEDPFPVPDPSHQKVGKKADGTFTNNASEWEVVGPGPEETTPKADIFDVVFHEDGTAEDVSPYHSDVVAYGAPTTYYSETYQRYVAHFENPYGGTAANYYKGVDYNNNEEIRYAFTNGHSLEVLCMNDYPETIPNSETKPFSAMQSGGTGFLVSTISGARQNELTFLPNISTSGANTWRWTTSGVVPESKRFYHIVGVWNAEEEKAYIYVDGELCNTVAAPGIFRLASSNCNWLAIGGDPSGLTTAHGSWNGDVAIARAYSKPLTADDVAYLWHKVQDPSWDGVEKLPEQSVIAFPGGIFNINGVRVEKTRPGIYIINGKKVLVK